jgi:single-strand DNA-binding protein
MAKAQLIGHLGRDADLQYLPSGTARATFRVAVNRRERAADGDWSDATDWYGVVAWDRLAERCGEQLTRGLKVWVEGQLVIRTYQDKQGQGRTVVEIVAQDVILLGAPSGRGVSPPDQPAVGGAATSAAPAPPDDTQDLPF